MAIAVGLIVFGLFGGALAVVGYEASQFGSGFNSIGQRRHLKPIPVSAKVCPYVRAMHLMANDFQRTAPNLLTQSGSTVTQVPWPAERQRLGQVLDDLEFAVVASKSHFPDRIQREFTIVIQSIRSGRAQLESATSYVDLIARAADVWGTGQSAFGDASDLIGYACSVPLAADS